MGELIFFVATILLTFLLYVVANGAGMAKALKLFAYAAGATAGAALLCLPILLLAQSEHPADKERIRTTFADKQRLGSRINLAAWATAYLAIEGAGGLDDIQRWYLTRPDRSREELRAIVKALSVIAGAEAPMREPVAAAYRKLLEVNPSLASDVSHDLIAWRRWDFAGQIRKIRTTIAGRDPLGAYALDIYLRLARGASPPDPALPRIMDSGRTPEDGER